MSLPVRVSRESGQEPSDVAGDTSNLIGRFFGPLFARRMFDDWSEAGDLAPYGVDVREDADHVYVEADLPGFRKEDIDITLQDGVITIAAEHRDKAKKEPQQKGDYLLRERRYERFERSFTLPQSMDEQSVNAKLDNGCLTITLNRTEQSKAKKIPLA